MVTTFSQDMSSHASMSDRIQPCGVQNGQDGFSLLEVMVSLMVLVIGLTSVILVFAQGASLQARGKRAMDSARLAQTVASELQYIAEEHGTLPVDEEGESHRTIESHAGWSDQYSVKVSYAKMNLTEQLRGDPMYEQSAYRVEIRVMYTLRGEQQEDVFYTAVIPQE